MAAVKVAVSALGPSLADKVDERFGRARWFLVADPRTGEFEAVDNDANSQALHGAGLAAAELLADRGAKAVLTGHLGPKAFGMLRLAGIDGYAAAGMTVGEALAAFDQGLLVRLAEAAESYGG